MNQHRVYSAGRVYITLGRIICGSVKELLRNEGIAPFLFGGKRYFDADEIDELVRMIQL